MRISRLRQTDGTGRSGTTRYKLNAIILKSFLQAMNAQQRIQRNCFFKLLVAVVIVRGDADNVTPDILIESLSVLSDW